MICLRDYVKATAFNKIRKLYHPKYDGYKRWAGYGEFPDSLQEQRDAEVRHILEQLEKDLKLIKEGNYTKKQKLCKL